MKKKIKALPKSIREPKRYFLFDCTDNDLKNIKGAFLFLFGALKLAESGFTIKPVEKKKIIKINSDFTNELVFCVFYYNKTQNGNAKNKKESGTIESLL